MSNTNITYIDEVEITDKRVLLRADFDVALNADSSIANDLRITHNLPTITHLLKAGNRVICVAKLNRPRGPNRDPKDSLQVVVERLKTYLPQYTITLIHDFLTEPTETFTNQKPSEILVLENIRFYKEEKQNDLEFAKKLASLADVYVNDAFAVSHRTEASIVSVPKYIPSYGGLLLKTELEMINKVTLNPQKPVVVILGGSKISTKINLVGTLLHIADHVLIGGGLANTFLAAKNIEVGKSMYEYDEKENAHRLLYEAQSKQTQILLPVDVRVSGDKDSKTCTVKKIDSVLREDQILDIGPETEKTWSEIINSARTIIWNGPVGFYENPTFRLGTDAMFRAVTSNKTAISVVGGGDTVAAISKKEHIEAITHVSTGGGAMLEYIEKGTLPGLEALKTFELKQR